MTKQLSLYSYFLIWFGAGLSIAEMITGTYFAPLGFQKGLLAIILGHAIGGILLFLAGLISEKKRLSSMLVAKSTFGQWGGDFFAILNVAQLAGWTAIMIYDGAAAANAIFDLKFCLWAFVIGALIILWLCVGITNLKVLNTVAMSSLFILTLVLMKKAFPFARLNSFEPRGESLSFCVALELSCSMPLSWLPLIGDYTKDAKKPIFSSAVCVLTYSLVSIFLYVAGMSASLFAGQSDIIKIMSGLGLGVASLVVIVLSTVTTTFLDAYSLGLSFSSISFVSGISKNKSGKTASVIFCILATILGMLFCMDDISDFLYLIGSVFAPMIAIEVADFFFQKTPLANSKVFLEVFAGRKTTKKIDTMKMAIWGIGFVLYRLFMRVDFVLGSTIPCMLSCFFLSFLFQVCQVLFAKKAKKNK